MAEPFDLRTQVKNKKGQVVQDSPYTLFIDNGVRVFERPPGSGNFFYESGEEIKAEHRPAAAPLAEKPKAVDRKELEKKTRALNQKLKEHAKEEGPAKDEAPDLSDDEQDALDALLGDS